MAQDDRYAGDVQKRTDFFVCDSVAEAEDTARKSDLPAEVFDRRTISDFSRGGRERILVFACPGCVEKAEKILEEGADGPRT
jgi:hypothetical protein